MESTDRTIFRQRGAMLSSGVPSAKKPPIEGVEWRRFPANWRKQELAHRCVVIQLKPGSEPQGNKARVCEDGKTYVPDFPSYVHLRRGWLNAATETIPKYHTRRFSGWLLDPSPGQHPER